jgi:hypothetical protein
LPFSKTLQVLEHTSIDGDLFGRIAPLLVVLNQCVSLAGPN